MKRENGTLKITTINEEPSKTQQQFRDETNINNIMRKYHAGQGVTHLSNRQGTFADVSNIKTYQQSLQTVIDAQRSFGELPSAVRKRFGNDPYQLVGYLEDPANIEESIKLGLRNPPPNSPPPPLHPQNPNPGGPAQNDESNDNISQAASPSPSKLPKFFKS